MSRRITAPVLPRVAALYCRVSSNRQAADDKTSLQTQLAALTAKAAELGYATSPQWTYQDAHSGEELHQRPALSTLRTDARAGHFGLVLAYNVYALAKNQAHIAILVDEFEHAGVGLDFVTESLENTPLGRMILSARTFAAEVEGERRRDRTQRALLAAVQQGRMPPGPRAPYGLAWPEGPEHRLPSGALRRDHLITHPTTWPILTRIWAMALAGQTQHAFTAQLSSEAIPTPSGRAERWTPHTIGNMLSNPIYWGEGMALRGTYVPVEPSVRHLYKHKSRHIVRPLAEQVPLPPGFAPAVVTPEQAAQVHRLAALHKTLATPRNADPHELLRGVAVCGYCGRRLTVKRIHTRPDAQGHYHGRIRNRTLYRCATSHDISGACSAHSIEAHKLDAAVWAAFGEELRNPERIRAEVERMRQTGDPAAPTIEAIDRQLADVRRKIANKRKYVEVATDDREIAEVAAEVTELRRAERTLEEERANTFSHFSDWHATEEGLLRVLDWCARVSGNLDRFTFEQCRETLLTLKAEVVLYKADHFPRVEMAFSLPLSGTLSLPAGDDACAMVNTTA